jgi:hypothetical protein
MLRYIRRFIYSVRYGDDVASKRRRNFIKLGAFGAGAFVVGKILGPSLNLFGQDVTVEPGTDKTLNFSSFRVEERADGTLGFYDKLGNEILVMDKGND